ncbi:MAG TPA: 3'(2'),5'-bisphosphate nucleotidase CysQ [Longimicrobium sp.]|jgi:myo-inositol-1(or 4)-monophosphatase|nr:3'(2'),5'-bisphosphate nucleotidase CysQ [Longimicrobium sp.]
MTSQSSAPDYAADLELALRAVRAAGDAVLPAFRAGQEVRYKAPDQPVTDADLAANRILHKILLGGRPEYGWLSEETKDTPERLSKARLWVVDPIDGTNSFVEGYPEFAISVGLVDRGRAVVGVVLNPATGEMYHAIDGGGAFLNGARIRVSNTDEASAVRRIAASRWEMSRGELDHFLSPWRVSPLGSTAYKMAKVADGSVDVFVSAGPKNEWDVAGAAVIVAEAGGRVTGPAGGELRYNQPDPAWRGIVASNGLLHDAVLSMDPSGLGP